MKLSLGAASFHVSESQLTVLRVC